MGRRVRFIGLMLAAAAVAAAAQKGDRSAGLPRTRPERTGYAETSRYDDVIGFMRSVDALSPQISLTTMGYTFEGRSLPLAVVSRTPGAPPEKIRASDRTRIYIQGNIHAGEVEGKEAAQMLLRDVAQGRYGAWLDSMVLLVCPIFNADGNEKISLGNRSAQSGPVGGVGQRANGQNYDLNRDHTKLDAPETRSLARLMNAYDPHVVIDLHTTNGTRHAYRLTYAPPLHPDTAGPIVDFLRKGLLPDVTRVFKEKWDWDIYYYGNLPWRGSNDERGWYTYDHRARYNTNYVGMRNRVGILCETYSYLPFEERIAACHRFVVETLDYIHRHGPELRKAVREAEATPVAGREIAVAAAVARSAEPVEVLMGDTIEERHPYTGAVMLRRADVRKPERMPEFGVFVPSETVRAPRAYLVPSTLARVVDRLQAHGIRTRVLEKEATLAVEQFRITAQTKAARAYQGHNERMLSGAWEQVMASVPAGTLVIPVDQALGRLACELLEPRSDDSLVAWNLMDDIIEKAQTYPVWRTFAELKLDNARRTP